MWQQLFQIIMICCFSLSNFLTQIKMQQDQPETDAVTFKHCAQCYEQFTAVTYGRKVSQC